MANLTKPSRSSLSSAGGGHAIRGMRIHITDVLDFSPHEVLREPPHLAPENIQALACVSRVGEPHPVIAAQRSGATRYHLRISRSPIRHWS